MIVNADRVIHRASLKFVLCLGVLISLLYLSALREAQIDTYELVMLSALTIAALAFDHLELGKMLAIFKRERRHLPHDQAIRVALAGTLKSAFLLKLLETNLLTLYYAFFARLDTHSGSSDHRLFSYEKSSNAYDVFLMVAVSQLPLLPFIHAFIEHNEGPAIAWVITLLTLWSVIWYLAQVQANRFRPIELGDRHLHYRSGLFWTADIPLSNITAARRIEVTANLAQKDHFLSPFGSARNVLLEFQEPVLFSGPYFITRRKKRAAVSLDDPCRFLSQLELGGVAAG